MVAVAIRGQVIQVSRRDLALVRGTPWKWWKRKGAKLGYARYSGRMLHREIMQAKKGEVIDHKDGITSDNRRSNLRRATRSTNGQNRIGLSAHNTSGVTGVFYFSKRVGVVGWAAFIKLPTGRTFFIWRQPSKEQATEVRRAMEVLAFGEFAPSKTPAKGTFVGKYKSLSELKAACEGATTSWGKHGHRCIYPSKTWGGKRWVVRVTVNGKSRSGGVHESLAEAIVARDNLQALQVRRRQ